MYLDDIITISGNQMNKYRIFVLYIRIYTKLVSHEVLRTATSSLNRLIMLGMLYGQEN